MPRPGSQRDYFIYSHWPWTASFQTRLQQEVARRNTWRVFTSKSTKIYSTVPSEIIDNIVAHADFDTLQILRLVSKTLKEPAEKCIFRLVYIQDASQQSWTDALAIARHSTYRHYVEEIHYIGDIFAQMAWSDDVCAQYAEEIPFLRDLVNKSGRGDNYSLTSDEWNKSGNLTAARTNRWRNALETRCRKSWAPAPSGWLSPTLTGNLVGPTGTTFLMKSTTNDLLILKRLNVLPTKVQTWKLNWGMCRTF